MKRSMKKRLGILFSLGLFLTLGSAFAGTPTHYSLIIDAGSTGSRLHLFEYNNKNKIPLIQDKFSENVKPGLSSYENNPQAAGLSLKKLLDDALVELQKNHIEPTSVSISVLGTAGMRLLPLKKQEAIYNSVSLYLKTHYPLALGEFKTIPGSLEGLFGWLDVNYLLKSFDSRQDITRGSIDMGGASTQIVFSTLDKSKPEDEFNLTVGEQHYTIYSKSFLSLGLVEAFNQVTSQPLATACYPVHYPVSSTTSGSFNFPSCGSLYLELISQYQVSQQIPSLANKAFIAYSGAYYTDNFFNVDKTPTKAVVENRVQEVCSKTWEELVAAYPQVPASYLAKYCANGVYLSQLLYETYQLQEQQLTVTNQINQQDLDWTLGALLYQLIQHS